MIEYFDLLSGYDPKRNIFMQEPQKQEPSQSLSPTPGLVAQAPGAADF
jgi:hypothetical protein